MVMLDVLSTMNQKVPKIFSICLKDNSNLDVSTVMEENLLIMVNAKLDIGTKINHPKNGTGTC